MVGIDTVIYFQVTDAKAATYEIANYIQGVEQLTVTTLRNVVGSLNLEETLTSRDQINAAAAWCPRRGHRQVGDPGQPRRDQGHRPAASIQDSMEKQMRADREKRAHDPHRRGLQAVRRSSPPRASGRPRSSRPRATRRPRCCAPTARRRRSSRSSTPSTPATPTRSCWPTSTSRCCRRSPGRLQQGLDRAERARRGAQGHRRDARRRADRRGGRRCPPEATDPARLRLTRAGWERTPADRTGQGARRRR